MKELSYETDFLKKCLKDNTCFRKNPIDKVLDHLIIKV